MRNLLKFHTRFFFALAFTAIAARPASAIQTQEVDLGRSGVYDGLVKIERDGLGRMTLCDSEVTSPVTLNELRFSGTGHWILQGLDQDDHTQYHNDTRALTWLGGRSTSDLPEGTRLYYTDTRARSAISADSPIVFNPATGVFSLDPATTPTFTGLILTGLAPGAIPYVTSGAKLAGNTGRLAITSTGIGINNASPARPLDISIVPNSNSAALRISNATPGTYESGMEFQSTFSTANYATAQIMTSHGGGYANPYLKFTVADADKALQERVRIDKAGNVGIGTAGPAARLDVAGTGRIRGALAVDGETTVPALNITGKMRIVGSAAQSLTTDTQTINCNAGLVVLDPSGDRALVSTPTIAPGDEGQIMTIVNSNTNDYVRFHDADMVPGTNLALTSGTRTLYSRDVLTIIYAGGMWCEVNYASNH